jgi:hypothetical protein
MGSVNEPLSEDSLYMLLHGVRRATGPPVPVAEDGYDGVIYRNDLEDPVPSLGAVHRPVELHRARCRGCLGDVPWHWQSTKVAARLVYPTTKLKPGQMFHLAPRGTLFDRSRRVEAGQESSLRRRRVPLRQHQRRQRLRDFWSVDSSTLASWMSVRLTVQLTRFPTSSGPEPGYTSSVIPPEQVARAPAAHRSKPVG